MTLDLRPSRACLDLVKPFEGLRPRAARLAGGGWTIGYGHTRTAREGAQVDETDAEALLLYDLTRTGETVREQTYTPLNQNQFDALTAFAFNIGVERFRRSEVLRRVNAGDLLGAAAALEAWRSAAFEGEAQVIDGLVRRRAAEKALFLTPPEGFRFVPTPVLRPEPDIAAAIAAPAAEVQSPMTGEVAAIERVHAPAPGLEPRPVETAAAAVSSRLQRLFPEPGPRPTVLPKEPQPEPADPLPFPAPPEPPPHLLPEPPPPPFPEPSAAHAEPFTPVVPPPPPLPATEIGPGDPFGEAAATSPVPARPARAAISAGGFAEEARGQAGPMRNRLYLLVGLLGVVLFGVAIAWMLNGKADTLNLLLGLAGVVCMSLAGAALVLPLLNRGRDRS